MDCHLCKNALGKQSIVYQDFEANRHYHYHEPCALKVKEAVLAEYFNLMCRVANYKLERRQ